MSRLQNNSDLLNDVFKKWVIRIPSGGTAHASKDSREEFSILIAVMLVLSGGIGLGAFVGIIIAKKKRKRQKRAYKTTDELPYPLTMPWYCMDMPGIEAFTESEADGTRRSFRDNTKYTVQKVPTNQGDCNLLRTPLRSSGSYKVRNQQRKTPEEQKREAVSLSFYESTPYHRPGSSSEIDGNHNVEDNLATDTSMIAGNTASHDNEGFDRSQSHERSEEKPMEHQGVCQLGENTPCYTRAPNTVRRVRFDLRGTKDRQGEKRTVRENFPDIVVISEEAEGNCQLDEHERKRVCDNEEASDEDGKGKEPAGVSSIFKDTRRSASVAAISDEEGTVVEI